ncbi:MAG: Serine hydrolase [Candidatus Saccharibacteria bacterium]|nr:Serine hydrolase [Candidatus Saccharibacteria bacterium]
MKSIPNHTLSYIDSWLELRYKWADIPGFAVAIAKDGKVLLNKAYGYADVDSKSELTTNHIFRIASHSKTFTATAIMQLQEQNKLKIDDAVVTYLPFLENHTDKRWQEVTIRQLLSHSAGVVRDGLDSNYWQLAREFPNSEQLQAAILETDLIIEPNTRLKYSNYGFSLLGEVIQSASKMNYNDFVKANIIEPLNLKNTYPDSEDSMLAQLPTGYSRQNLQKERLTFPHRPTNGMSSATGFCSTTEDLCTYFSAHFVGSGKLLSDASKKEMQRMQWKYPGEKRGYGLGLNIGKVGARHTFGHGGGFPGFVTKSIADPKDGVVVTVLANCHGAESVAMAKAIYGLIDEFGEDAPNEEHLKYEGRFGGLHGTMEIIANTDGIRAIYPNSWFPLGEVEKLSIVDDDTLKVEEASGAANYGEKISYVRNADGSIMHIIDGGSLRLPTIDGDIIKTWK